MKFILILFSIAILSTTSYSQNFNEREIGNFEEFWDYSGWGFFATPMVYQKPIMVNKTGTIQMTGDPKYSFEFGAKRYFSRTFKWSFNTGITVGRIPSPNYKYNIVNEIPNGYFYSGDKNVYDGLHGVFVKIPLNIEYKQRLGKNIYINFSTGLNIGMGYGISSGYTDSIFNQTNNEQTIVFLMNVNQNTLLDGQVRAGFYVMFDRFLLQTNLVYNKSFTNLWEGEYSFSSVLNSGRTVGTYKQSGDYVGLSTTVFFKRRK